MFLPKDKDPCTQADATQPVGDIPELRAGTDSVTALRAQKVQKIRHSIKIWIWPTMTLRPYERRALDAWRDSLKPAAQRILDAQWALAKSKINYPNP